jgi:hypothetical protein
MLIGVDSHEAEKTSYEYAEHLLRAVPLIVIDNEGLILFSYVT